MLRLSRHIMLLPVVLLLLLTGCREHIVSDDPTLRLTFSVDTLCFDTVFTSIGSATRQVMIYNPNKNALRISSVALEKGAYFRINIDGEVDSRYMRDIEIGGGDSLYLFVQVKIDPQDSNMPVLVEDKVVFAVNGNNQALALEAYGQDVHLIRTDGRLSVLNNQILKADKPYLIFDTLVSTGTLKIEAGARLYFHQNSFLQVQGSLRALGTQDAPIRMQGSRIDNLFDSVPYAYAAGGWGGVYLLRDNTITIAPTYTMDYVEICSANVGLYGYNDKVKSLPTLRLSNSRIHNHALYCLAIQNMNAEVVNTEISNAASYCVYLSGGTHRFIHSTIASYFGSTDIRIQSAAREDVAAVYIDDLSKDGAHTRSSFYNSIIMGPRAQNLTIATPFKQYYKGHFVGNYIKGDTLTTPNAAGNTYWQETDSAVFENTFYKYQEYRYYNFQLREASPARAIGDSLIAAPYPTDRLGKDRSSLPHPDAGCYQY